MRQTRSVRTGRVSVLGALATCASAAWSAPMPRTLDAGDVAADTGPSRALEVAREFAPWVRVRLAPGALSGLPANPDGSAPYLRLISLTDNAEQVLTAETLAQWGNTSAYFNGPIVRVELWNAPGAPAGHALVEGLTAGTLTAAPGPGGGGLLDLCDSDNRVPSADNRVARLVGVPGVCTAWMFNDTNRQFLSAGHCAPAQTSVVQFNCPPSDSSGLITNPHPDDQYAVDGNSVKRDTVGTSNDWAYFGVFPNANHGLTPRQRYGGGHFTLAAAPPAVNTSNPQTIRVTGYGLVTFPVDPTLNNTQQTDAGPYTFYSTAGAHPIIRYSVDTTGGNSGSPVVDLTNGQAIGIHYLAGCTTGGNQGTASNNVNLVAAIAAPLGVCRSGKGTITGNLYGLGDNNNNFGTVNPSPNLFARISTVGSFWSALTWDYNAGIFYAANTLGEIWTITTSGVATLVDVIDGAPAGGFTGLAFNPKAGVLWGVRSSTGQLYHIDLGSAAATPVGPALGMTFHGLAFDTQRNRLWALSRTASGANLVWIDQNTFAVTNVGTYASTFSSTGDLAFNASNGDLYTMRSDGFMYRLNATTGALSSPGSSSSSWPTANGFGLAYANPAPACPPEYDNNGILNSDDLGDYITDYFSPSPPPAVDWNGDGNLNPDDLGDYITRYYQGC